MQKNITEQIAVLIVKTMMNMMSAQKTQTS